MGETRDPALGRWTVFEGDDVIAETETAPPPLDRLLRGNPARGINDPIMWPITLRVGWIRDGMMEGVDVEVTADLSVAVTQERTPLRLDAVRSRMRRMTGEWTEWEPGLADERDEHLAEVAQAVDLERAAVDAVAVERAGILSAAVGRARLVLMENNIGGKITAGAAASALGILDEAARQTRALIDRAVVDDLRDGSGPATRPAGLHGRAGGS